MKRIIREFMDYKINLHEHYHGFAAMGTYRNKSGFRFKHKYNVAKRFNKNVKDCIKERLIKIDTY